MSETPPTKLYTALLAAMKAAGPVVKNATNPHLKSKYADLGAVIDAIEQPLWENGLLVVQRFQYDRIGRDGSAGEGTPILITELIHAASGEKLESVVAVTAKDPTDPQKIGAAITYYRRYSLLALLGLAPEDDDGHAAAQPPRNAPPAFVAARPRETPAAPARPQPPTGTDTAIALTDEQEKVIAQAWDMAEAGDSYGATKALVLTLKQAASDDEWKEINRRWFAVRVKHFPMTVQAAQPAAYAG